MSKNSGLGRGLGALIPQNAHTSDNNEKLSDKERVFWVAPAEVEPNPYQPRKDFEAGELDDLVVSIREHGVLQPLVVTRLMDGKYELIAGERRWRAAQKLKLTKIPVIIREARSQDKLVLSLIENIQRSNLNPVEEGKAYKQLVEEFHFTHGEIAEKTGKSSPVIANRIRLLKLPQEVQDGLIEGKISATDGRNILSLPDEKSQLEFYRKRIKGDLSVMGRGEDIVKKFGGRSKKFLREPELNVYEEKLRQKLNARVDIERYGTTGKITIRFYAPEDLERIVGQIMGRKE